MDDVALTLQRQYEQNTRRYLGALVAAAVCTLVPGEAGGIAVAPAGAAIGILVALLFRRRLNGGFGSGIDLQARWLAARSAAESIRSLTWRHAVGAPARGEADRGGDSWERDVLLVIDRLPHCDRERVASVRLERADWMDELYAAPENQRRSAYIEGRIIDQRDYLAKRVAEFRRDATRHRRRTRATELLALVLALAQVAASVAGAPEAVQVDIVGPVAALLATFEALTQLRREESTADRYEQTYSDLTNVATTAPLDGIVEDVEALLLAEHRSWYDNLRLSP